MGAKTSKPKVRFRSRLLQHNSPHNFDYVPLTIADASGQSEQTSCKWVSQDVGQGEEEDSLYPPSTHSIISETDILSDTEDEPAFVAQPGGHFVNAKTMNTRDQRGHQVRARHIHPNNQAMGELSSQKLISLWQKPKFQEEIKKCILSQKIHKLKTQTKMAEMSNFLVLDDEHIRRAVLTCLRQFVYACEDNVSVEEIASIEENVWKCLLQHQDHVFDLGILNLMLFSCLLCNPDRSEPTVTKLSEISATRKDSTEDLIKEKRSTATHDLLKAILRYHEVFPKRLRRKSGLVFGSEVKNAFDINKQESLTLVKKAHFCDKFTHLFSLLKQTMVSGCEKSLSYMKFIRSTLLGGRCPRENQVVRMLLVTGCVHSLSTAFNTGDVEIGDLKESWKTDLTELITRTIENLRTSSGPALLSCIRGPNSKACRENRFRCLIQETLPLLWHPGMSVRKEIRVIHERCDEVMLPEIVLQEIERGQAYAGLHIDDETSESSPQFRTCKGRMGTQKVLIHAHKPNFNQFYCTDLYKYIDQRMRDRMHNFDMLRKLKSHPNLVELFAYNVTSVPLYYIVEDCQQRTLQHYVLQRRMSIDWLTDLELCDFLMEITSGLKALHQQKVLLRDLTLNNMFLVGNTVKIGDLSVACSLVSDDSVVRDFYPGEIPTRWTCHEALLDGTFSPQSDIWALGLAIYCLWTHGCDPFTEYYNKSTEEIMRMVMFENILPFQWYCIPDEMYTLLSRCMRKVTTERIELDVFRDELLKYIDQLKPDPTYGETTDPPFDTILKKGMYYPVLSRQQIERKHVPEKGVPRYIQEFRKVKERGYINMRREAWRASTVPVVTEAVLKASDDIILEQNPTGGITVKEVMTEQFVKDSLPKLTGGGFPQIGNCNDMRTDPYGPGFYLQHRLYPDSDTLDDVAGTHAFDTNTASECNGVTEPYIHLCYQVAETLRNFHEKNWLHNDLRAKNFLVNRSTREVYVSRVCRMKQLSHKSDIVVSREETPRESKWWHAPETLIENTFSAPGDVYMWAMMTYEVLESYDLHMTNPSRSRVHRVPYCMLKNDELIMAKQNGDFPTKPDTCPEWLYTLLQRCWHPDRSQRPTIEMVVKVLRDKLRDAIASHQRRKRQSQLVYQYLPSEGPPVPCQRSPPRKRFERFRKTLKAIFRRNQNGPSEDHVYQYYDHASYSQANLYESLKVRQTIKSERSIQGAAAEDVRLEYLFSRTDPGDQLLDGTVQLRRRRGRKSARRRIQEWKRYGHVSTSSSMRTSQSLRRRSKRRSSATHLRRLFPAESEVAINFAYNCTNDNTHMKRLFPAESEGAVNPTYSCTDDTTHMKGLFLAESEGTVNPAYSCTDDTTHVKGLFQPESEGAVNPTYNCTDDTTHVKGLFPAESEGAVNPTYNCTDDTTHVKRLFPAESEGAVNPTYNCTDDTTHVKRLFPAESEGAVNPTYNCTDDTTHVKRLFPAESEGAVNPADNCTDKEIYLEAIHDSAIFIEDDLTHD
ncbi:uncharacterized protein [Haliotis asinina]|uniref:uncharacterized protein n=1 Tax=Haliotis asinina TaxID=109174 RepID=UPI003531937A